MSDPDPDLIERLLDEFVERLRRGECPSISAYQAAHPDCAEQIRELFPAVEAMEQAALRRQQVAATKPATAEVPERLGDFRLIREIGRGGMGIVYEAEQASLSRHVAVKVLPLAAVHRPLTLRRFRREALTAARLHHTNIVPVFGVGEDQGFHYIVMQLIQGAGTDRILRRLAAVRGDGVPTELARPASTIGVPGQEDETAAVAEALVRGEFAGRTSASGSSDRGATLAAAVPVSVAPGSTVTAEESQSPPPPIGPSTTQIPAPLVACRRSGFGPSYWRNVARIGAQAADALHYAHQRRTLHRDIKPANLLIDLQGVVWISDFGLAKAMEHDDVSQTGDLVGTLRYMAPERFQGQADARSDIYSLGLTLYEFLTLRPAYDVSTPSVLIQKINTTSPIRPRAIDPQVPRDLETIVLKAAAREPGHRYSSAGELADDLQRFLDDRPIRARRVGAAERLWRWTRRNPAVAGLSGAALALLVVVAIVTSVGYVRTKIANREVREALASQSLQRQIADRERSKAESLSGLALEAIGDVFEQFVPSRVTETTSLALDDPTEGQILVPAQPVLSKEAVALLDRMLVFYDRLAQQNPSDPGLRAKVADASRRVGDIRRRLGHFDQAKAAYLQAIERYRQLEPEGVSDPRLAAEVAHIYNELGNLAWTARWQGEGRPFHLQAAAVLKAAPSDAAALSQSRYELARACYFLGRGGPPDKEPAPRPPSDGPPPRPEPDRRGPPPRDSRREHRLPPPDQGENENRKQLQQAIEILEGLTDQYPREPDYRHLLACCYRDRPPSRPESSGPTPFASTDKAIEILQKLVEDFPQVPEYRHDLSKAYAKVDLHNRQSDATFYTAAESRLRKALSISEQLVAEYPNVPDYAASRVQVLHTLSEIHRRTRRHADAEKSLRQALDAQSSLAQQYPQVVPYQSWKAILQESLARLLANRNQSAEARALLQSSIPAMEQVLKREPQAAYVRAVLGRSYASLADILMGMGQRQQAEEMLRRGRQHRPE